MASTTLSELAGGIVKQLGAVAGAFSDEIREKCRGVLNTPVQRLQPDMREAVLSCITSLTIALRGEAGRAATRTDRESLHEGIRKLNLLVGQLEGAWRKADKQGAGSSAGAE